MSTTASRMINAIPKLEKIRNKTILITGATGLIASRIVEMITDLNNILDYNVTLILTGRSMDRLVKRFEKLNNRHLLFWEVDLDSEISLPTFSERPDFIIHAASSANPKYYQEKPVETMTGNILGCLNLLHFFNNQEIENFLFISSGEVYGDLPEDVTEIDETMIGIVDGLSSRSCYPVSKRAAETLCVSWSSEYQQKTTIVRPSHIFGPGFNVFDTRISAEFFRLALNSEDIVLKSSGLQNRSYTYIDDCVTGILTVLLNGVDREAYNVTKTDNSVTVKDFSRKIAEKGGVECRIEIDSTAIQKTMKNANLSDKKLRDLGWIPYYSIDDGIAETFLVLKNFAI